MPLPLSHSAAGLGIHVAADRGGPGSGLRLLGAVVLANAPDLDMLPGLLVGDPNRYHQGITHTFAAALLTGLVVWAWVRLRAPEGPASGRRAVAAGALAAALWASHLVLDMLTIDFREPVGIPALWPISAERFQLVPVFSNADKLVGRGGIADFLLSLMTWHNLGALAREALLMAPVVALAFWWRHRRTRRRSGPAR